ncbi:MAG: alpha/beta fold hydrolase [Myxococcota bacterium]
MKTLRGILILTMTVLLGLTGCSEAMGPDTTGSESGSVETSSQALSPATKPGEGVHTATTSDGETVSYRVIGEGSRDIVMVHGWSVDGSVFDLLANELQADGYRLIIPDLRGTGDSSKPASGYTIENYARDVLAVASDARSGRFVLVGHSMGGAIAQKVASMRPGRIQGLMLMSPVPASGFPLPQSAYDLFYASAENPALKEIVFQISSVALEPSELQLLMDSAATVAPQASRQSLEAWTGADFADELFKIRAETLILVSDDPFMNPAFLQQTVADPIGDNASVTYFGGAGHYVQVEKAAETADVIDGFIDGLPCHPHIRAACQ